MPNECDCDYPGCRTEGKFAHTLELTNEKEASVNLMYCEYHKLIVAGNHFTAMVERTPAIEPTEKEPTGTPEKIDFVMQGPFLEVEMAEQVLMARELTKKK